TAGVQLFALPTLDAPSSGVFAAAAPHAGGIVCFTGTTHSVFLVPLVGWGVVFGARLRCTARIPGMSIGAALTTPKGTTEASAGSCTKTPGSICRVRGAYTEDRRFSHTVRWDEALLAPANHV